MDKIIPILLANKYDLNSDFYKLPRELVIKILRINTYKHIYNDYRRLRDLYKFSDRYVIGYNEYSHLVIDLYNKKILPYHSLQVIADKYCVATYYGFTDIFIDCHRKSINICSDMKSWDRAMMVGDFIVLSNDLQYNIIDKQGNNALLDNEGCELIAEFNGDCVIFSTKFESIEKCTSANRYEKIICNFPTIELKKLPTAKQYDLIFNDCSYAFRNSKVVYQHGKYLIIFISDVGMLEIWKNI